MWKGGSWDWRIGDLKSYGNGMWALWRLGQAGKDEGVPKLGRMRQEGERHHEMGLPHKKHNVKYREFRGF